MARLGFLTVCVLASGFAVAASAQQAVPDLTGRVVDRADLLSDHAEVALTALLAEHEAETSNQVAVLTVPSLEGEPVESFAVRVATAWELGTAARDNGVLLLVAVSDRALRIEVGAGLEETLTDALSGRIIRNEIVPRFREENYEAGVRAGVEAIVDVLTGAYEEPLAAGPGGSGVEDVVAAVITWAIWLGFLTFVAFILVRVLFALPAWVRWPLFPVMIPGYVWAGSILGETVAGRVLGGVLAAGLYVLMFAWCYSAPERFGRSGQGSGTRPTTRRRTPGRRARTGRSRSSRSRGGGGGRSFGGSFGGGSSFSGGGGSFSGGGASGSW